MRISFRSRLFVMLAGLGCLALGLTLFSIDRVHAADATPPAVVHITAIPDDQFAVNPKTGNRVHNVYNGDAGSIAVLQVGDLPRHTHETASEMFYVIEGSAQITVGDAKQSIKAGDLMIVPKGVVHSIKSDSGLLKAVLITMPPRSADDVHFMN